MIASYYAWLKEHVGVGAAMKLSDLVMNELMVGQMNSNVDPIVMFLEDLDNGDYSIQELFDSYRAFLSASNMPKDKRNKNQWSTSLSGMKGVVAFNKRIDGVKTRGYTVEHIEQIAV